MVYRPTNLIRDAYNNIMDDDNNWICGIIDFKVTLEHANYIKESFYKNNKY